MLFRAACFLFAEIWSLIEQPLVSASGFGDCFESKGWRRPVSSGAEAINCTVVMCREGGDKAGRNGHVLQEGSSWV